MPFFSNFVDMRMKMRIRSHQVVLKSFVDRIDLLGY